MQKTKLPSIVSILILTMITTVMWVGFSIYRAFSKQPEPSVPEEVSATLNPSLNSDTINKVESALYFSEDQIPQISSATPVATSVPTPLPTEVPIEEIPTESPAPEITPTPSPTP